MRSLSWAMLITIFFLGCSSSLTVQVDIFDGKGINPGDVLKAAVERETAQHVYLLKTGSYARTKSDLKIQLRKYLDLLAKPDIAVVTPNDVSKFAVIASSNVDTAVNNAAEKRNVGTNENRKAETLINPDERQKVYESALDNFTSATQILNKLRFEFLKPYQGLLKEKLIEMEAEITPDLTTINNVILSDSRINREVEKSVQTLTGALDLFDDHLAPFIISASENYWQGVFNKTEASGQIGNTDIAIKMETIGTFTIKGVRLDASKVTEASFQVLKQSVKLVAAAYGIPTPGGTPPTVGDQISGSPAAMVMNIDQLRQTADLKRQKSQYAALSLLDLIISERLDLLSANNPARKAAVDRIKKSFQAYKPQLSGE